MDKRQLRIATMTILVVCFFLYGNSLKNKYALDDEYVIVNHEVVMKGIKGIPKIFTTHYSNINGQKHDYRPITLTSFALEYEFFKAKPKISHLINILLYAITCIVLLRLLLRLFKSYHWALAALATFIFLIHPVHSEVVNNVKSRDELLCFLFAISSLFQFIKYIDKKRFIYLLFGVLFLALSLLSKLSSLTFLAIIPFTIWFFTEVKPKKIIMIAGGGILVLLAVRTGSNILLASAGSAASRDLLFYENPLFVETTRFYDRIPMAFYSLGYYLKLLVFPKQLLSYYGYNQVPIVSWGNIYFWLSFIIFAPISIYAIIKVKTKQIWIYGLIYLVITMSMFINLVRPVVGIIGERYAYIPSLGFSIVAAFLLMKLFKVNFSNGKFEVKYKAILIGFIGLLFIVSASRIVSRNSDWHDVVTLLRADTQNSNSAKSHALLANNLLLKTQKESSQKYRELLARESIFHFEKSVEIYPDYSTSWNNMGTMYFNELRDSKSARACFERAVEIDPEYVTAMFSLAYCYEITKEFDRAVALYDRILILEPTNENTLHRLDVIKKIEDGEQI